MKFRPLKWHDFIINVEKVVDEVYSEAVIYSTQKIILI